jgi:dihydrodipicolinate synthase/N-acetylneuraminate lyase
VLVIKDCVSPAAVLDTLRAAPEGCWVYSHPSYSTVAFTPDVALRAQETGTLPSGAKVSKVTQETVAKLRDVTGQDFELWHGSSRNIAASLSHGATGVVSAPLSTLPDIRGQRTDQLQLTIDAMQNALDSLGDRTRRIDFMLATAAKTLGIHESP